MIVNICEKGIATTYPPSGTNSIGDINKFIRVNLIKVQENTGFDKTSMHLRDPIDHMRTYQTQISHPDSLEG